MKLRSRGVSLGIKDKDLSYQSYRESFDFPTQDEGKIAKVACDMLKARHDPRRYIRALTVTAIKLESEETVEQIDMFYDYESAEKKKRLSKVIDDIKSEFGSDSIKPAVILDEEKMPKKEQGKVLPGKMHK